MSDFLGLSPSLAQKECVIELEDYPWTPAGRSCSLCPRWNPGVEIISGGDRSVRKRQKAYQALSLTTFLVRQCRPDTNYTNEYLHALQAIIQFYILLKLYLQRHLYHQPVTRAKKIDRDKTVTVSTIVPAKLTAAKLLARSEAVCLIILANNVEINNNKVL